VGSAQLSQGPEVWLTSQNSAVTDWAVKVGWVDLGPNLAGGPFRV
jgi:hypothetical protein